MESNTLSKDKFKSTIIKASWRFGGMILLGLLWGYLVYQRADNDEFALAYFLTMLIGFSTVGLIIFLVRLFKALKKYNRSSK